MKNLLLAVLLTAALTCAWSQSSGGNHSGGGGGSSAIPFVGAPTGSCTSTQTAVDTTTGNYYSCDGGTWNFVGPGSSVPTTPTAPDNVTQTLSCAVSGGTCSSAWALGGIPINAQTGVSYSIQASDRASLITQTNGSASAYTAVNPTTSGFENNFFYDILNLGTGTVTESSSGFNVGGGTSLVIPSGWLAPHWSDNGNYIVGRLPTWSAFPACGDTGGNHLNFNTNTGISCGTSSSGGAGTGVGRTSASVAFASAITDGSCAANTFTWTGVATTDTVIPGWPSALNTGVIGNMFASAANTVTIRLCNFSGASVTPGTLTYNATLAIYNLSGSATIDFAAIPDGSCAANTFTLTNVSAGDPVTAKWPSTLETGLIGIMTASAANTIQVRLCNFSGASVDPASQSFGASIAK